MPTAMETIQAVSLGEGLVSITCPGCNVEKRVSLKRLAGRHLVKVKCSCQNRFNLEVNHRKRTRRKVDIPAYYEKSAGEEPVTIGTNAGSPLKEKKTLQKSANCRVVDLSKEGIAIQAANGLNVTKGDTIKVFFNLDDYAGTEIYQDYRVKNVIKNRYGCAIIGSNIHLDFFSPISR